MAHLVRFAVLAVLALMLAAATGCGTSTPGSTEQQLSCGSTTCGGAQYCASVCTCCGIPDAGPPSGYEECRPIPSTCHDLTGDALRTCLQQETGGESFDPDPRRVEFPCA